jgi:hypothetical protein
MAGGEQDRAGQPHLRLKRLRMRIKKLVAEVYAQTHLRFCCDPRDLAQAIGFEVRPANVERAYIAGGILRFPNRALLPQCGHGIFMALARYILVAYGEESGLDAVRFAALELAFPESIARTCRLADLAKIQPHFPLAELENAVMGFHVSGIMAKQAW